MRIAGITVPDNKRIEVALRYIYGVGPARAIEIIEAVGIPTGKKAKDLDATEVNKVKDYIEKHFKIEGELRSVIKQNIALLKDMGSYRGTRHARRLPVNGQRTKTNSRTVRGNTRKTAGSGKRKVDLK
jgi:small subunit ribosomal protein S13